MRLDHKEEIVRLKTRRGLMILGISAIALMLSGCFFSEQQISINEEGKADVSISFWFKTGPMGSENQGSIAMSQLLFSFPEIQTYEMTTEVKKKSEDIFADEYLVYTFKKEGVDIEANKFMSLEKKEDGSYLFLAKLPAALDQKVKESENKHIVTIRVTLPTEIEMANSLSYEGRTVEWQLRTNDFTKDIVLKAFTKATY